VVVRKLQVGGGWHQYKITFI